MQPLLPVKSREEYAEDAARQARGVTLAAIYNWALAAFLMALLLATIVMRGMNSRQAAAAAFLVVIGVPALLLLAEGLRRARELARIIQISVSSLILFANAAGVLRDLRDLMQGDLNPSTNFPSLVAGILIVWGLTRRQTVAWFAEVTSAEALRYHDLHWFRRVSLIGTIVGITAVFLSLG